MSDRPAVPFFDAWTAGLRTTWGDELRAWRAIQERGVFLGGPEVAAFEAEWAAKVGAAHAVGVASGTAALTLALRAAGIHARDRCPTPVLIPAFTCPATAAAVLAAGALPVLADVDPETGLLDPQAAQEAVEEFRSDQGDDVRAIIPVHLFGRRVPKEPFAALAREHGLVVIEDAAQAHGLPGVGAYSDAAAYSFYPTKNLGARGDAGAVTTDHQRVADACRHLRQYGMGPAWAYGNHGWGWCERMDEIHAASLRIGMRRLEIANQARAQIAAEYRLRLPRTLDAGWDHTPSVHHLFPVRVRGGRRDAFRAALRAAGVETGCHYPMELNAYPGMRWTPEFGCRNAAGWAHEVVSLPCYPGLRSGQVETVIAAATAAVYA